MAVKRVKNPGKKKGAAEVGALDPCWAKGFNIELPNFNALPRFPDPKIGKKFLNSYAKMLELQARQVRQIAAGLDSPDSSEE